MPNQKDKDTVIVNTNHNFTKINNYEIIATTNGDLIKPVFDIKIKNDSNYYLEIIASGKSVNSSGGLYIFRKDRIINDSDIITIKSISNEIQSTLNNTSIILTKNEDKVFINLLGSANKNIRWTLNVNIIIA